MVNYIDKEKIIRAYEVIDNAQYAVISMAYHNESYAIPVSMVRVEDNLFFHTGQKGKKIDFLEKNPFINITIVGNTHVPNLYNSYQAEAMAADPSKHGKFVNSVFTTNYESVIINDKAIELTDVDHKVDVMRALCQKYTPNMMDYFNIPIERSLSVTKIFKISLTNISFKNKEVKS